jgi:hypothetical protein
MTQIFPFSIEIPTSLHHRVRSELQNLPRLPYGSVGLPQYLLLSGLIRKLVSQAANLPPILFEDPLRVELLGLLPELGSGEMAVYFSVKYLHMADDGSEDIRLKLEVDAGFTELGLTSFDRRSLRPQHLSPGPNGELIGALAIDVTPIAKDALTRTVPLDEMSATRHWDERQGCWVADIVQTPSFLNNFLGTWNPARQNSGRSEHISIPRQGQDVGMEDLSPSSLPDHLRMAEFLQNLPAPRPFRIDDLDSCVGGELSNVLSEVQARLGARLADRARSYLSESFISQLGISPLPSEVFDVRGHFDINHHQPPHDRFDRGLDVPAPCQGCTNYHGKTYRGNKLICGIHPHGVAVDATCADYSTEAVNSK